MTSQIRVDEITNRSGLGTVTIYDNGFEFTGVTTFTEDVDITGGLTIGGVLTYEDTTNIDSVGVVTARAGIRVTGDSIHVESSEDRLLYLKSTDANAYLTFEDTDSSSGFANRVGTVSDGLYFSTGGGGERLRITSAGDMGLGTASPRSITNFGSFAINGTAGSFTDYFLNGTRTGTTAVDSNGFTSEAVGSSTPFRVITNGSEKLRITSAGQLNLAGNMQFTAATPELEFNNGGPRFRVPAANTLTIHTGGGLGATSNERLRIDADGTILTNAATIDNTSSHGVIVAHAPASNADTGYKSIEIGNSNGSGTSRGSTICGQPKSNSHPPYTLVGCWDDGSTAAVYYGGGFGSNMRPATTHRFYTNGSYPTSNGSGTERLRIDPDGSIILGYGGASLYFQNGFNDSNSRIQNGGGTNNSNLKFYTRSSGTEAERLRIQSDGNVIPMLTGAYNLGISGNKWNKVWTNYVRYGTRSATYEKTFTATSDGSGNLTFDCGILWLIDDSSFEVFCHLDRTGAHNSIAARYKFYGSKVSGFGTQGTYRSDTGTYYIISPMSNPTITHYTPSGFGSAHGTRISHTSAAANAEYRLTMLINWVGQQEVT